MGYLSVFISLMAGAAKGFLGKKISGKVSDIRGSVSVNLVRMILCILISGLLMLVRAEAASAVPDAPAWIFGSMAGLFISLFTITWLLAIRHGAYMLISVAQMFGVVVTLLCSFAVFKESPSRYQLMGVVLLCIAVPIMGSYSAKLKGKLSGKAILLPVLCGLSGGLYDFSQKLYTYYSKSSISTLNFLTYIISALLLLGMLVLLRGEKKRSASLEMKRLLLPIFLMSVCLFLNSYFKALATEYLTATQIYPVYQAGGLIAGALMSALFFKERITPRCGIGLILAFSAILLLK